MDELDYVTEKYGIDLGGPSPFSIPCNRLTDLPALFRELNFRKVAEVGVCDGMYSEILCRELPDATVYSIDPWVFYPLYHNFRRPRHYEPIYKAAVARLAQYPNSVIKRMPSQEALACFADGELDAVFIDADHRFKQIAEDLDGWTRKVRLGGIVSGHDFAHGARSKMYCHVEYVVRAWAQAYEIHPWFILEAHRQRSWMWVKMEEFP